MGIQSEIERIKAGKEDIRAAIAAKGQSVPATALLSSYGDKIRAIQTGTDTSDATAAAGDILSGKTAYVKGQKVSGTIASQTASSLTASGATVSVPAGYYPSQVSKSVAAATQATPSIDVSPTGLITASAAQAAGYVASGTKSATQQLTTQDAQTITPGTRDKTIASGQYLTGAQTVKGDANLLAANIKYGVSIFGVRGKYRGNESSGGSDGPWPAMNVAITGDTVSSIQLGRTTATYADLNGDIQTLDGYGSFSTYGMFCISLSKFNTLATLSLTAPGADVHKLSANQYLVSPKSTAVSVQVKISTGSSGAII